MRLALRVAMTHLGFRFRSAHTAWHCGGAMSRDAWDDEDDEEDDREARREARRRRRRRRNRPGRLWSDEERTYRDAQRVARRRIGFFSHLISYAGVIMMLAVVAGRAVAGIVATCWGLGLAFHYFSVLVAPELRRRMIDHEVKRQ